MITRRVILAAPVLTGTALVLAGLQGAPAFAYWASTGLGTGRGTTDTMNPGQQPSGSAVGQSISLTWPATTTGAGHPVTGYRITRYTAATAGTATAATGGCAGTVTTTSCTESGVAAGTWYYAVTPVLSSWTGAESARTSVVSAVPLVAVTSPASGSSTNNTRPTLSGTATGATTVTVRLYAGSVATGTPSQTLTPSVTSGAWSATPTALTDGTYTLTATAGSTTSAARTFTVDTVAPAVTLTAPANGSTTASATPTFSGAAGTAAGDSSSVSVAVYAGGSATGTPVRTLTATASAGAWSVAPTTSLPDGAYTATAGQSDAAGNTGTSAALTFTVDTVAPAVTLTAPVNGSTTASATPSFSGAAGTAAGDSTSVSVAVYAGSSATGTPVRTLTATASAGAWSVATTTSLPDGTYTAAASQSDAAGNTRTSTASTFTVATVVAPTVTLTAPAAGSYTNNQTPTFSGSASGVTTVSVKLYSGSSATGTPVQTLAPGVTSGTWSVNAATVAPGTYTVQATASNSAGAASSVARTFTVDTAAPSVTSVTLTNGGTAGTADAGDKTTITFSEVMDATKICSGWTNDGTKQTLTGASARLTQAGQNDTVDNVSIATGCGASLNFGTVATGGDYVTAGDATFASSTLVWDPVARTLTLTLGGTPSGTGKIQTGVTPGKTSGYMEPTTGVTDLAGNYPTGDTATTHTYVYTSPAVATSGF